MLQRFAAMSAVRPSARLAAAQLAEMAEGLRAHVDIQGDLMV